jgi:hypothetical protein
MGNLEDQLTHTQKTALNSLRAAGGAEVLLPHVVGAKLRNMGFADKVDDPKIERRRGYSVYTAR